MRILVTGCAGFIGSHLAEHLLAHNHEVVGIDTFVNSNSRSHSHVAALLQHPRFTMVEDNLSTMELTPYLRGTDVVFHQAAIPGVRDSWGSMFEHYTKSNILATQRLLDACRYVNLKKFIYASSSSVYGGTSGPTREDSDLRPLSPYGMSKLAAEHLVRMYHTNFGVPTTSLRYFTVYGPRQRPDMAFHKFFKAILENRPIQVYGDGQQTRDFTYVSDIIEANLLAMKLEEHGNVFNVGGGQRVSLLEVLQVMRDVTERNLQVEFSAAQPGDPLHTWADISKARQALGYQPVVSMQHGLKMEWDYIFETYSGS